VKNEEVELVRQSRIDRQPVRRDHVQQYRQLDLSIACTHAGIPEQACSLQRPVNSTGTGPMSTLAPLRRWESCRRRAAPVTLQARGRSKLRFPCVFQTTHSFLPARFSSQVQVWSGVDVQLSILAPTSHCSITPYADPAGVMERPDSL